MGGVSPPIEVWQSSNAWTKYLYIITLQYLITHTHSVSFDGIQLHKYGGYHVWFQRVFNKRRLTSPHLLSHHNVKTKIPWTKVVSQARLSPQRVWPVRLQPRCPKWTQKDFAKSLQKCKFVRLIRCNRDNRKLVLLKATHSFHILSPHTFSVHVKCQYICLWVWWFCVWNKINLV